MIDFYTQIICLILIIIITVLFLKILYSYTSTFQTTEQFTSNEPIYFGKLGDWSSPTDKVGDMSDRLKRDKKFIDLLRQLYNERYFNTFNEKTLYGDDQIMTQLEDSKQMRGNLDEIPEKYRTILTKYKQLNNDYQLKKKHLESNMLKKYNENDDVVKFNKNNMKLKRKLKELTDNLEETQLRKYTRGMILKNIITKDELVLPENTNSESIEKYFSGTNLSEKESKIYYLALNNNYLEVKSLSRNGLESNDPPTPNKKEQMFQVHKINNNETYNGYIKLSGNYKPEDILDVTDNTVEYPFYIISPFVFPGYAMVTINNTITIRPIRNDPYQRFDEIFYSTFCELQE